jgi:SulP family sulfate permease
MVTRDMGPDRDDVTADPLALALRSVPESVQVFEVQGPFFFGAADRFKETVRLVGTGASVIILRLREVPAVDATGLHVLREFHDDLKKRKIHFLLSGVHAQPLVALQKCGLWDEIGEENMFENIDGALNRARRLLGLPEAPRPTPFVPTVKREAGGA